MASIMGGLPVGQQFQSQGRTLGEGDFSILHAVTWTTHASHTDRECMKETQFGERVLAGPVVLAVMAGLATSGRLAFELERLGVRYVALLGFEKVRFEAPVLPGDTLTVDSKILNVKSTGNPTRGVMRIGDVARKQTGTVVAQTVRIVLFERERGDDSG